MIELQEQKRSQVPNFQSNSVLNQEAFQKQFSTDAESVMSHFALILSDSVSDHIDAQLYFVTFFKSSLILSLWDIL